MRSAAIPTVIIGLDEIDSLTGGRLGHFDVPCPSCGPQRRSPINQRRKVLRIWRVTFTFATYCCARCEMRGYAREDGARAPDPVELARTKAAAEYFAATATEAKRHRARWLWGQRRPIAGTPAERYLRETRAYGGPLPATIGFLPARAEFAPAMIAAFAMPAEIEPGQVSIVASAVMGVHLTRLTMDGSAKAGTDADKIMIGTPRGVPIALAAAGDLLGLAITEGIEDALSVHEATGLGVWAAGAASLMPALGSAVPRWIECATILVDDDHAGWRNADELGRHLQDRGIEVRLVVPRRQGSAAA
jgi:hypothetical protein